MARPLIFLFIFGLAYNVSAKKKVSSVYSEPLLMRGSGIGNKGFMADLMDEIYGAGAYEFLQPPDGRYGRLDQGSWNGMIGEALNGNVDIIAADLTITAERAKVLEFTVPFMSAYTTIISRKPERRGSRHGYGGRHQKHKYRNVLEMLDNPSFKFMTVNGGSTYSMLKKSKIAYQKQIYQRIQSNVSAYLVSSYNEGIQRLEDSEDHDLGMIAESPRANWYKTKNCDIYTVGNLGERYYGLAVKRSGSPSADIKTLSDKILELQASGKMTLLIDRYFGDSKCYRKERGPWQQPDMSWSPTGQGMMIDKAYFGGDGSCSSMKWDVSDIKDDMHDIKRQLDDLKTRIVGS